MIDDLICDLLDEPSVQDDNSVVFTDKALELIHEIAEKCKDIPIVKENQKQMEEYAAGYLQRSEEHTSELQSR